MSQNVLRDELAATLKTATEQDDQRTIAIIRLVQAALKERDERRRDEGRDHHIGDAELIAMLETMVEQRSDSMRRYEENGQLELANREAEEIEVIQRFLPPQLDEETSVHAINQVIAELGASKLKDIGRVMMELKNRYPGQMNFAEARRRICDQLN
ncbi:MAG: GatB/YqeY domain-containing protein [Geminicoccaceae bacterium]